QRGAMPAGVTGWIAPCYPRIATDETGNVWPAFRGKPGGNWRVGVGSVWYEYVTRLAGDQWAEAVWVPRSSNVLDNRPAVAARENRLTICYSGDGRGEMNPAKLGDPHLRGTAAGEDGLDVVKPGDSDDAPASAPAATQAAAGDGPRRGRRGNRRGVGGEINADLFVATVNARDFAGEAKEIALKAAEPAMVAEAAGDTAAERDAIAAMRKYNITL